MDGGDLRAQLEPVVAATLARLAPAERESLLIKCWMSHDARWFMAAALEFGLETASRLNRVAVRETGRAEARRIVRALGLPPVTTVREYLAAQQAIIGLLGPDLLDYEVADAGDNAFRIHVSRCFAYDNAVRAGIAGQYDCGIFHRTLGWTDALGLEAAFDPPLARCLKAQGRECAYAVSLAFPSPAP